jgi:hypothetical protein
MSAHAPWLASLSRRLLHRDTFETMVSPALADLEAEASQGWRQRARHYAGLTIVLACALVRDIRVDAGLTSFASTWQTWRKAVFWHLGLAIPMALLFLWATPWQHLQGVRLIVLLIFAFGLFGAPVSTTAAAFYLRRDGLTEPRAVIAALAVPLVIFAPVTIAWNVLGPPAATLIHETAAPRIEAAGKPDENILQRMWLANFKERSTSTAPSSYTVWNTVRDIVAFPSSALIGVWLARRRGWKIFRGIFVLQCAFLIVGVAHELTEGPGALKSDALATAFLLLGPALVWLLVLRGAPSLSAAPPAATAR